MKAWQTVLCLLTTLGGVAALTAGPVSLLSDRQFINFTLGATAENSVLRCKKELVGEETLEKVEWTLQEEGQTVGTYMWQANGEYTATGRLDGVVLSVAQGDLHLTSLSYDLSGEYSCIVFLTDGQAARAAPWEVLILDSTSHQSSLQRTISECMYTSSFSTHAMFPKPVVRAGLYSDALSGFYQEIPQAQWQMTEHENKSVTYSFTDVSFELNSEAPTDIRFYVMVGVMKNDGNYVPVSSAHDKDILLQHLGCPEPRLEEYQRVEWHQHTITCRKEYRQTEGTVTCKDGFHSDGDVAEVLMRCNDDTRIWVLEDDTPARREHLECVIDGAPHVTSASVILVGASLAFLRAANLL